MVSRAKLISWLGEAKGIHAKDSFFLSSWLVPPPRQQDYILEYILPSKPKRAGVGGVSDSFFRCFSLVLAFHHFPQDVVNLAFISFSLSF